MNTYKPGKDHPWRQYKNKPRETKEEEQPKKHKPVKDVLIDIIDSWDSITLETETANGIELRKLHEIKDKKIAQWLINLLNNYL